MWLLYKCTHPCDLSFIVKEKPLSCPYCDQSMLHEKPIKEVMVHERKYKDVKHIYQNVEERQMKNNL